MGCLLLFLAPFFASGIFLTGFGLKNAFEQGWHSDQSWGPILGGAMFLTVSSAFLLVGKAGHNEQRKREQQIEQNPHEPWKWNSEWETGWVSTKSHKQVGIFWLFAVLFMGFGIPIIIKVVGDGGKEPLLLIFLLFPLMGVVMFIQAFMKTLERRRFRNVALELTTNPAPIGGRFRGIVWVPYKHNVNDTVRLKVRNYHLYFEERGAGSDRREVRFEDSLWETQVEINPSNISRTDSGETTIPVEFDVPPDAAPSTMDDMKDCIQWDIKLESEIPGIDLDVSFDIPVFNVGADSAIINDSNESGPMPNASKVEPWYDPTILIDEEPDSIHFERPPNAVPQVAVGSAVAFLVVIVMAVIFISVGVSSGSVIFGIVAPIFLVLAAALIGWSAFNARFMRVIVSVASSGISIKKSSFLGEKTKDFKTTDVTGLDVSDGVSINDKKFYRVSVKLVSGKKVTLFGMTPTKREAQDIATSIESFLNVSDSQ